MTIADPDSRRLIISLAVFLSMAAAAATPSLAQQSKAVTGKGYWQETRAETCSSAAICILNYSAVPAAKQITITNVNCALTVNGASALIREVRLGSKLGSAAQPNFTFLTLSPNGVSGGFAYYSINNSTLHILRAGETANITLVFNTAPAGEIVKCTIGGLISA